MTKSIDFLDDSIDVRDIIARLEELESDREDAELATDEMSDEDRADPEKLTPLQEWLDTPDGEEYERLHALMSDLAQCGGGDEQWRGDWYPLTLIADRHFTSYAQELIEDCGDIPRNLPHYVEIDWEATARNIRMDYTSIDVPYGMRKSLTFWVR
jgi:hypothetical protein